MVIFEDITAELAPEVHGLKDLAEEMRDVLFPIRGKLFTRTYKDPSILYDEMINGLQKAVSRLGNAYEANVEAR